MSDPILEEEDDLISQDDIDKLLDISSEDEDAGELSQDDIDSLLNGPLLDDDDNFEDDGGELSQDDIDQFMNDSKESDSDDDDELISLEDIQGAISGDTHGNDASESEPED